MIIETTNSTTKPTSEISRMLKKLRTLVPGIPPEQEMTQLEIMQHVIDYITELETVLEDDDTSSTQNGQTTTTLHHHHHHHHHRTQQTELVN